MRKIFLLIIVGPLIFTFCWKEVFFCEIAPDEFASPIILVFCWSFSHSAHPLEKQMGHKTVGRLEEHKMILLFRSSRFKNTSFQAIEKDFGEKCTLQEAESLNSLHSHIN